MCLLRAFLGLQHLSKWALAGALAQSLWGRLEEIKGKKEEKRKQGLGDTGRRGQWTRGGKEKGITDGGKLEKHGSHNSGESEVIRIMCESIKLLAVTPLSAPRKYICRLKLIGLCCKRCIPPSAYTLRSNSFEQIMVNATWYDTVACFNCDINL